MVGEALKSSVNKRKLKLIEFLSKNIMGLMLSQLFRVLVFCLSVVSVCRNANSVISASKVIYMCKPMHRRQHEKQDVNCTSTCLEGQTLPGIMSFYLRVYMT